MTHRLIAALRITAATLTFASPALAQTDAGSYLAARQAGQFGDYAAAATYFNAALLADANNLALMEQAITSYLGTGQVLSAASIATPFYAAGGQSRVAYIATMASAARNADWDGIFAMRDAGQDVGPMIDGLAQAWAYLGQDDAARAFAQLDDMIETPDLRAYGQLHKALALAYTGDLAGAEAIYALPPDIGIRPNRASVMAHVQILCALGEFSRADDLLTRAFGRETDPEITLLRRAIDARVAPDLPMPVATPADGIAIAYRNLSDALKGEVDDTYLLLFAQAASHISPNDAKSHIAAANLFTALDQYDSAAATFAKVAPSDVAFHSAELGRAEALRLAGRFDQAIEVLTQLTRSHPDVALAHAAIGDIYRQLEDYAAANAAYDAALAGYADDAQVRWWILYTRGITYERLDQWPQAEADFRAALALNPDHPSVLNYLGYSLVDRGMTDKYDEALAMIETAVAARPDSGAIVDSLAWVYYKLGRYQDAVAPMERAAQLEPNDPVISDHLGDVYWKVGRAVEARFQWRRALSFDAESAEAERIRRKIEIGLDAVYQEDGVVPAPAVEAANDR